MENNQKLSIYNLVTQSNKLIESKYSLSITEQRLILAMISMINPEDEDFREYNIQISDLNKVLGLKNKNIYSEVKNITESIMTKVIKIPRPKGVLQVNWISSADYNDDLGTVKLKFDPNLKPYLLQLKEGYTSTKFGITAKFKSFNTTRIYQLLKQYEKIGKRSIKIDFLYKIFDQYDSYKDFKRRIIEPARKEINKKSDIKFSYEENKIGNKVYELKFIIRKQSYIEELPLFLPAVKTKTKSDGDGEYTDRISTLAKKINEKYEIALELASKIVADAVAENPKEDFDKIFDYIDSVLKGGKIRNTSGFVISCFREKYYNSITYSNRKEVQKEMDGFLFKEAKKAFLSMDKERQNYFINRLREDDSYFKARYDMLGFSSVDIFETLIFKFRDELIGEEYLKTIEKNFLSKLTK